jgi:hypothetical protein
MKIAVFWDMTPCSLIDVCQCYGGFYASFAESQYNPEDGGSRLPQDVRNTTNEHGIAAHSTVSFNFVFTVGLSVD